MRAVSIYISNMIIMRGGETHRIPTKSHVRWLYTRRKGKRFLASPSQTPRRQKMWVVFLFLTSRSINANFRDCLIEKNISNNFERGEGKRSWIVDSGWPFFASYQSFFSTTPILSSQKIDAFLSSINTLQRKAQIFFDKWTLFTISDAKTVRWYEF